MITENQLLEAIRLIDERVDKYINLYPAYKKAWVLDPSDILASEKYLQESLADQTYAGIKIPDQLFFVFKKKNQFKLFIPDYDLFLTAPGDESIDQFLFEFYENDDNLDGCYYHPGVKRKHMNKSLFLFMASEFDHHFFIDVGNPPVSGKNGRILHMILSESPEDNSICVVADNLCDFFMKLAKLPLFTTEEEYDNFDLTGYIRSDATLDTPEKMRSSGFFDM